MEGLKVDRHTQAQLPHPADKTNGSAASAGGPASAIKRQVREFYDQVGWQEVSQGVFENALYEDLRLVSREYIHRCHLRVSRHLQPEGRFLLDAGSGPVQYPEYLEYSRGYQRRVCMDISMTALLAARQRLQAHGLYVVADIAHLPFRPEAFDGVVSLHTIHHLPPEEHIPAYRELLRTLAPDRQAVVVVGLHGQPLTRLLNLPHRLQRRAQLWWRRVRRGPAKSTRRKSPGVPAGEREQDARQKERSFQQGKGTYHAKYNAAWLQHALENKLAPAAGAPASQPEVKIEVLVWRSVGVRTLKQYVHARLGGRSLLHLLYNLEERFPRFFGRIGAYPLIVLHKLGDPGDGESHAA